MELRFAWFIRTCALAEYVFQAELIGACLAGRQRRVRGPAGGSELAMRCEEVRQGVAHVPHEAVDEIVLAATAYVAGCSAIFCASSCENWGASCSVTNSFSTGILFRMLSAFM